MLTSLVVLALWEKILLPVVNRHPVSGANGSLWETVVTIRNASDRTVDYYPVHCPLFPPGADRWCVQNFPGHLEPGVTQRVDLQHGGPMFLHVTPELADKVFVQLRVHDFSRQAESFGTEVPVIRSKDMKTDAGQILDIPRDPRFRLTFRLYVDEVARESEILVRFINEATAEQRELRYTLQPRPAGVPAEEPIAAPWLYQQISGFDATRIKIEPKSEGMRYWAFVSVTNNDTQQITTLAVH